MLTRHAARGLLAFSTIAATLLLDGCALAALPCRVDIGDAEDRAGGRPCGGIAVRRSAPTPSTDHDVMNPILIACALTACSLVPSLSAAQKPFEFRGLPLGISLDAFRRHEAARATPAGSVAICDTDPEAAALGMSLRNAREPVDRVQVGASRATTAGSVAGGRRRRARARSHPALSRDAGRGVAAALSHVVRRRRARARRLRGSAHVEVRQRAASSACTVRAAHLGERHEFDHARDERSGERRSRDLSPEGSRSVACAR